MATLEIDAVLLRKLFLAGAYNLEKNKDYINELNVFPVPDGDTGSNMTLTIMSAAHDVEALENPSVETLSKTISSGSLKGARGNSGVILSQILRGFCKEIRDKKTLNIAVLADGFIRAVETAYKAVMKPKEGTILSVAKAIAERAADFALSDVEDIEAFAEEVIEAGNEALAYTPEQLPVLKEAGVVDSGGQGLMEFLNGAYYALIGKMPVEQRLFESALKRPGESLHKLITVDSTDIETSDIKYGYCTEFIINLEQEFHEEQEENFKNFLLSIGNSLVCVADEEIVKIHVHTNHPGQAFEEALKYGYLTNMKIDNMREEHKEKVAIEKLSMEKAASLAAEKNAEKAAQKTEQKPQAPQKLKPFGFVAVAAGEGISQILRDMGVDYVIEGGQTMNPSTEDILNAGRSVPAETVFILPNNKNIILAAVQAIRLEKEKKFIVVPSNTIPQGIAAMIGFNPEISAEDNLEEMRASMEYVKSGQVTYAVRDTVIDGREIFTGDYMGIDDTGIRSAGKDILQVVQDLVFEMQEEDSELVSLYYGSDVDAAQAEEMLAGLQEKFPDLEFELHEGGQPVYYYILSVE